MTYSNSTDRITIGEALRLYEYDVCVVIEEGQHVTLSDEFQPLPDAKEVERTIGIAPQAVKSCFQHFL